MLRCTVLFRCSSAAAAAAGASSSSSAVSKNPTSNPQFHHNTDPIPVEKGATPAHYDFAARYEQLRAMKDGALASEPYESLMANLKEYDALLRKYSVKQTELERARKAAQLCGLEWTRQKERKATTTATSAAAAPKEE